LITINAEKGLIRVEDWADICSRPGFDDRLDPTAHQLASIIGRYAFKDRIPCGLSNCRTPHTRGYVVATTDGIETNIGKDCGKTYFGVDFETMSKQFDRDITEKENRETLWSFYFKLEDLSQIIADIRCGEDDLARGADWVHKKSRPLITFNQGCPQDVVQRVREFLRTGTNTVFVQREASSAETERAEEMQGRKLPRPHYVEEAVGQIAGLDSLQAENDLREILVIDLETQIKAFAERDIDHMTYAELDRWVKWVGEVEPKLQRAREAVLTGRRLLVAANLECLMHVIRQESDKEQFAKYLKSL